MKISTVVSDVRQTVRLMTTAMANGLRAADNFAGDGTVGQVLTSTGPNTPPSWQDASAGGGPVDVNRLVGIINATNIVGAYPGITGVGPLSSLIVLGSATIGGGISVTGTSSFAGMTTFTDGTNTAVMTDGARAGYFTDGTRIVVLANGINAIDVTGNVLGQAGGIWTLHGNLIADGPAIQFSSISTDVVEFLGWIRADSGIQLSAASDFVISGIGGVTPWLVINFTTGDVTITSNIITKTGLFIANNAVAADRGLVVQSAGSARWELVGNSTFETGGNVGTDFEVRAYDDTGTLIDSPITIVRAPAGVITVARPVSTSKTITNTAGLVFGLSNTAKIGIDGTDGVFVSGENSLYENGGNIFANVRGGFMVSASNISLTGRVVFRVNVGATGATNLVSLTDGGAFAITGTASVSSTLVVGTTVATNILDVRTGTTGAWGQYAVIVTSAGTSYQGGLLLTNAASGVAGNSSFKFTATFASTSASKRFRMGWVDNSATETWLDSANGAIEIGPLGSIGLMGAPSTGSVLIIVGVTTNLSGTDQRGMTIDSQSNSAATVASNALVLRSGTQAAAYTSTTVRAIRIVDTILGAGSTITTQVGVDIESQTHGGTNYAIRTGLGWVSFGDAVGIGSAPATDRMLYIVGAVNTSAATTQSGIVLNPTAPAATTTEFSALRAQFATPATAFTMAAGYVLHVQNPALGAGSAVTTLVGLRIDALSAGGSNIGVQIAQGSGVNGPGIQITGGTQTGSTGTGILSISQTWNTTGSPTALFIGITNTASAAGTKVVQIQVGATNRLSLDTNGQLVLSPAASTTAFAITQVAAGRAISITQPASVTLDGIIISGGSITGGAATSLLNLAQTWNTTGFPLGILLNITNTASGASARLMDLQVGGASKHSVDVAGNLYIAATQVVSTRATGWTAWTGTATRTSNATGTATLQNVAEAVKALIDDLIHHGLIGT